MTKFCMFVLAACLAYVNAQIPKPCAAPKEWEARIAEYDPAKKFDRHGKVSYDYANLRVRLIEDETVEGKEQFEDVLYLHDAGVEYRLDIKTRKCERRPISRPFPALHVPSNATWYGEYYIGTSSNHGAGVLVDVWGGHFEDGSRANGEWTQRDCLPISFTSYKPNEGYFIWKHYDYTLGISDPMVFIPPKECLSL
ncbi:mammalian ependymin-related protein 1-like [Lineus longissimus]|uniref:mammalian ependymin-related protein 1-like n=1 Tax=Lineus longissimus TaxID=88925 RepID=UPI002B4FA786